MGAVGWSLVPITWVTELSCFASTGALLEMSKGSRVASGQEAQGTRGDELLTGYEFASSKLGNNKTKAQPAPGLCSLLGEPPCPVLQLVRAAIRQGVQTADLSTTEW